MLEHVILFACYAVLAWANARAFGDLSERLRDEQSLKFRLAARFLQVFTLVCVYISFYNAVDTLTKALA